MWGREIEGLKLTFHLAGINNQNFLMRDEETGTFWQQISGKAVSGPLTGKQLPFVHSDELTFALWKQEAPGGSILADAPEFAAEYSPVDWDVKMQKIRTVIQNEEQGMKARDLVLGAAAFGASRAYPMAALKRAGLANDRLGTEYVLLVLGPDNESVRVFRRSNGAMEFYRMPDSGDAIMMDAATGSKWNFRGCAVEGFAKGTCLPPVDALLDYWFDWRQYHADTTVWRGR